MQDKESTVWLSKEYKDILANREAIAAEFKDREKSLEYLSGVVCDLFVDWQKTQGHDAVHRIPEIHQVLQSNDLEMLLACFENEVSSAL